MWGTDSVMKLNAGILVLIPNYNWNVIKFLILKALGFFPKGDNALYPV